MSDEKEKETIHDMIKERADFDRKLDNIKPTIYYGLLDDIEKAEEYFKTPLEEKEKQREKQVKDFKELEGILRPYLSRVYNNINPVEIVREIREGNNEN